MSLQAMLDATRGFPQHLLDGLDAADGATLPGGPFDNVLFCGMGGSAIGGTLTAALLASEADVPLVVNREHTIPTFVGERTLVVATSYSGNTHETLDAVRACLARGATLVAITTGGQLGELAEDNDAPVVAAPEGFQPRAAVGWLFAANYGVASRILKCGNVDEVRSAAEKMRLEIDELSAEDGPAAGIAAAIGDGPVGVIAHDVLGVVAERWAGEINENGKRVAFHSVLPEMAHNQLVGWDGAANGAELVLLRRKDEGAFERVRFSHLAERAAKAGANVVEVTLDQQGIAQVLQGILVGDLVSLALAKRAGLDPEPVEVIHALKGKFDEATSG